MIDVNRVLNKDRTARAMTGLTIKGFNKLVPDFEKALKDKQWGSYRKRKQSAKPGKQVRQPGGGAKGKLKTVEKKLLFILVYFKCYPTFDIMACLFDMDVSAAKRQVESLASLLEKTLGRKLALPKKKIRTLQEFFEMVPEARDVFIDVTERPRQRPKNKQKQKKCYSGKKKRHGSKNTVISDEKNKILYVGSTVLGSTHDYKMFKQEFDPSTIPKDLALWLDMGYTGIKKDYPNVKSLLPKRKPKGKELTDQEKQENRVISGIRILSEHAIGGVKRMRIVSDTFRNKSDKFNDKAMFISCGLWNYQLKYC